MSTLLVDELYPSVQFVQPVRFRKNIMVKHVRPWIYKHGTLQDGNLQLEILQGATVLATATINYVDINAAMSEDYAHGYIRFDFDMVQLNVPGTDDYTEYLFRYSMINHSLDTSNFMGMVRQYEHKIYPTYGDGVVDSEAQNDAVEPSGVEIYEYIGA